MRNVWTIALKELRAYFVSPIAYIVLAAFALQFGYVFSIGTYVFVQESARAMGQGGGPPMNVNQWIVEPALGNFTIFFLLTAPLITMRLFAEEKRSGTIELLMTSPIKDYEIIIGKWLGAFLLYACMLALAALTLMTLFVYSTPEWKPILVAFLGLLLMGGMFLSVGQYISTLTKNQIVAAFLSFVVFFMLYVLSWVQFVSQDTWANAVAYVSVSSHAEQFSKGVIELKDTVYYLSGIVLGCFLSKRSLESLRWRT